MIKFNLFFYLLLALLSVTCGKIKKAAAPTSNEQHEERTVVLRFTEKATIDYAKDNPMETILWNNPIKPTTHTDLLKILPDNVKIPSNMAFVAGIEFEDTRERIKGFFIDKKPFSKQDYELFLNQSAYSFSSIKYNETSENNAPTTAYLTNWYLADAYCQWLGKRLPTKAEWTFAFSDVARIYPTNVYLKTTGDWEWLADWHLPEGQNPHIFVPDASSKKVIVKKKDQKRPVYEWKPVDRQNPQYALTCRCVQDVVLPKK